jgi:hypothetical protein
VSKLTLSFLYANLGEQVLKQLGETPPYTQVFSDFVSSKIWEYKACEGNWRKQYQTHSEFMANMVAPVMDAFLRQACPSAKEKPQVAQWIFRQYLSHRHNGAPILAEDLYKIGENIEYFDSVKKSEGFKESGASADLLQYKTYADFEEMLAPWLQRKAEKEELDRERKMDPAEKAKIMAETTVLYDGPEGKVVVPHTPKASIYWGSNTKWCIAGEQYAETYFPRYNKESPVIYLLPKGQPGDKVALVDHTLWNSADKEISSLPEAHDQLMQQCLNGLSKETRRNAEEWMPREENDPAPPASPWEEKAQEETWALQSGEKERPDPALWNNRDFVMEAVRQKGMNLQYAPANLQTDREILLEAVAALSHAFKYASPELLADREFMMEAVQRNGMTFKHASPELRDDREISLVAARQNGLMLWELPQKFKNDREFVIDVVSENRKAWPFVPGELKDNPSFITRLLERGGMCFDIRNKRAWQPDETSLKRYQVQALEQMHEKGDMKQFLKYTHHFKEVWGDPEMIFAADPEATLKKIKAGMISSAKKAAPFPGTVPPNL